MSWNLWLPLVQEEASCALRVIAGGKVTYKHFRAEFESDFDGEKLSGRVSLIDTVVNDNNEGAKPAVSNRVFALEFT